MKKALIFSVLLTASACGAPKEYTSEEAVRLPDRALCREISMARRHAQQGSCGLFSCSQSTLSYWNTRFDVLMAEYQRRNPNVSQRWIDLLRIRRVSIGMPESVAACSWNARIVNESIGYDTHSIQYESPGHSYFFVDGFTGRVDYIST